MDVLPVRHKVAYVPQTVVEGRFTKTRLPWGIPTEV